MGTTWVPLLRGYHFGYQTGLKQPQKRAFFPLNLAQLRESEPLFATHNPKVSLGGRDHDGTARCPGNAAHRELSIAAS
jgi:hypothetical protein